MLKFARHSRSSSMDRSGLSLEPIRVPRASSCERTPKLPTTSTTATSSSAITATVARTTTCTSPPPPIPSRQKSKPEVKTSDYEAISTLCLLPSNSSTITSSTSSAAVARSVCMAPMTPTLQKLASAMAASASTSVSSTSSCLSPKSVLKKRYDFHRAVEKLVQERFVPTSTSSPSSTSSSTGTSTTTGQTTTGNGNNPGIITHLDTSSESGYGSDQDSLNNLSQSQVQTASPTIPPLPPRPSQNNNRSHHHGNLRENDFTKSQKQQLPFPSQSSSHQNNNSSKKSSPKSKRKQVKFDSYVMLLQGLRDRDLEVVRVHLEQVSDAALLTEEVSSAFLTSIVENREDIVSALLHRGFDANASADSAGLTGLHLAAAFNYLPIVRLLLSHGACIFALAHSSGKRAADLCSRNLPGYQACHAYLRCMEECLGVANQGKSYASQSYHTARSDELELVRGQGLTVLRKGDYSGSSWWWCQDQKGHQGYVLREILSLNCPTAI